MRLAVLNSQDEVVNVVLGDTRFYPGDGLYVRESDDAQIGDMWKDSKFVSPVEPDVPPPLAILSDRQFYMQLVAAGYLQQSDALTLMQGVIPDSLLAVLGQLPQNLQFPAKMALLGNYFDIESPFIGMAAPMFDSKLKDRANLEAFWRAAALL